MDINYESRAFPSTTGIVNGANMLPANWNDILWAALTVGRPNRHYVFRHGQSSQYEALFRMSLVRMAVQQSGSFGRRLRRTEAVKSLDPTEKGAVSYFLGMVMCKLFSLKLLDTAWLLHLDVFRPLLNPVLNGRSRPDLIGESSSGTWIAFESKGRVSPPDRSAKDKSKAQALRCLSVNGQKVTMHIGAITFFKNDSLQFYWEDPPNSGDQKNGIRVQAADNIWRFHYLPTLELLHDAEPTGANREEVSLSLQNIDLEIGIAKDVLRLLQLEKWREARTWCREHHKRLTERGFFPDGIRVVAGKKWQDRFDELEFEL
ncbi:MAG TPA: hypothetical protein VG938_08000 [Verrucomicrobiae bacterium]|jgi:hypothetical protein|nr:hypothetical protein [Verrucomicrobiae bacterium]